MLTLGSSFFSCCCVLGAETAVSRGRQLAKADHRLFTSWHLSRKAMETLGPRVGRVAEEGIVGSEGKGHQVTWKDPFLRGRYFLRLDSSLLPQ